MYIYTNIIFCCKISPFLYIFLLLQFALIFLLLQFALIYTFFYISQRVKYHLFLPTNEIYVGLGGLDQNSTMGLKHGPKAIGEDLKSLPFFLCLGPRMGLTRVMRWPKNTSYSRHARTIKSKLR